MIKPALWADDEQWQSAYMTWLEQRCEDFEEAITLALEEVDPSIYPNVVALLSKLL